MHFDQFMLVAEVAAAFKVETWMLVGGLMVHCHAQRAGIRDLRPTDDADILVQLATQSYVDHARTLETLGFTPHDSLDSSAPFHRFIRNGQKIDLMTPDRITPPPRYRGRNIIQVPGSDSALKRTIRHKIASGEIIRLPDLASALSLKGAAHMVPSANSVRHLQDSVTLLACAGPVGLESGLSKSMRKNLNHIVACLSKDAEAWSLSAPETRTLAVQCIRTFRQDWDTPLFLRSTTPAASARRRRTP